MSIRMETPPQPDFQKILSVILLARSVVLNIFSQGANTGVVTVDHSAWDQTAPLFSFSNDRSVTIFSESEYIK